MTHDPRAFRGWDCVAEAVLGEVTTRLLLVADALPPDTARDVLRELLPGSRAERAGHPVERVVSAELPFNVDCQLATGSGARIRTIGVVAAHAVLTGGHVLQGSASARVVAGGETGARHHWSHYSARPGYVEVYRKSAPEDLADAFLKAASDSVLLDLAGVGKQVIDLVHRDPVLDKRPRLQSRSLHLRWAALLSPQAGLPSMEFVRSVDGSSFQIYAVTAPEHLAALRRFCEDVALHSWLLSTMTWSLERSMREGDKLGELGPALEYLGHLWSPGENLDEGLDYLWESIEARLHLSRGWHSQVTRVRDQISLLTLKALQERAHAPDNSW